MIEQTFAIIKPDGIERGLGSAIISRIESSGLSILDQKEIYITKEQAEKLYAEHKGKSFYAGVLNYMMSGKVKVMKIEGDDAVAIMRALMGPTMPDKAPAGTIRGDFKVDNPDKSVVKNTIHGSDSADSAKRELGIFFE